MSTKTTKTQTTQEQATQTTQTTQEQATQTPKDVIITGSIVRAYNGKSRFNDVAKNRFTIKSDSIDYPLFDEVFKNNGPKLTPSWLKDRNGYINLTSLFNVPVKDVRGKQIDFEDWIADYPVNGAEVKCKVGLKDGAIYPVAIVVLQDGVEIDNFEGM